MPISVRTPPELRRLAPAIRGLVRIALAGERRRAGEIGVVLADDATLRSLNRQWRGLDRATDVLSFGYEPIEAPTMAPLGRPDGTRRRSARSGAPGASSPRSRPVARPPVTGDLVVSMDRVRAQAKRFRVSEAEELARLVIHGALHLAGLDHAHVAERRHVRSREDAALGIGTAAVRALARAMAGARGRRRERPAGDSGHRRRRARARTARASRRARRPA